MPKTGKTQPQMLLEDIICADAVEEVCGVRPDFASIEAQAAYWDAKDAEYEAYLNEQHAQQLKDSQ